MIDRAADKLEVGLVPLQLRLWFAWTDWPLWVVGAASSTALSHLYYIVIVTYIHICICFDSVSEQSAGRQWKGDIGRSTALSSKWEVPGVRRDRQVHGIGRWAECQRCRRAIARSRVYQQIHGVGKRGQVLDVCERSASVSSIPIAIRGVRPASSDHTLKRLLSASAMHFEQFKTLIYPQKKIQVIWRQKYFL